MNSALQVDVSAKTLRVLSASVAPFRPAKIIYHVLFLSVLLTRIGISIKDQPCFADPQFEDRKTRHVCVNKPFI